MAQSIFSLFGEVFVETDKAEASLAKTEEKAGGVASKLSEGIKTAGKWGGIILGGATVAAGAMTSVANKAAEQADEIDKASIRMGIGTESYQELAYAAGQCGVEMSTMERAAKQLEGTDMNMDEAMASIMALGTEEERAARAAELFGEATAYKMKPLIQEGEEGFNGLKDRAHELGIVMSEEAVSSGVQFGDLMSDLQQSLSALTNGLGASFLPILNDLITQVIAFMPTIQSIVQQIFPVMADLLNAILPPLISMVQEVLPPILEAIQPLIPLLSEILQVILPPLTEVIKVLAEVISAVLGVAIESLTPILDGFKTYLGGLIDFITGVFTGDWEKAWSGIKNIFKGIFDSFEAIVKAPLNAVIKLINKAFSAIGSVKIPSWVPVIGGNEFSLPQIPLLANGGTIVSSGSAIVGEAGAELIEMPTGARVTPLDKNGDFGAKLDSIVEMMEKFMPLIGQGQLVLDTGTLVGATAPMMNTELGRISAREGMR